MRLLNSICAGAIAVLAVAPAIAGTVDPGFQTTIFPANDDNATDAIPLGFSANFFGVVYSSTFVSNNGYLTFNSPQGAYTPSGLGTGYTGQPIIAAFFADVDTRGATSGLTSYGTGTYAGHTAFGATWPAVGYYPGQTDLLNTFQIILTDRSDVAAGDFDIYFNYDQIQWETGGASGGSGGLGGISAAVGFNAGTGNADGTYFELPGSLVNGAFLDGGPNALIAGTNDGVPGQYEFSVRNGQVIVSDVPEPLSVGMFGVGLFALAAARRRRA
jgi:Nidogen-like/PEP-CTERM motif